MLGSATATMLMPSAAMKTVNAAAITSHHRIRSGTPTHPLTRYR
jgi:hypothetical protein